jgi:hypothetical protein
MDHKVIELRVLAAHAEAQVVEDRHLIAGPYLPV